MADCSKQIEVRSALGVQARGHKHNELIPEFANIVTCKVSLKELRSSNMRIGEDTKSEESKRRKLGAVEQRSKVFDLRHVELDSIERRNTAIKRMLEVQPEGLLLTPVCSAMVMMSHMENPREGQMMELGMKVDRHLKCCRFLAKCRETGLGTFTWHMRPNTMIGSGGSRRAWWGIAVRRWAAAVIIIREHNINI